jgi:hypothetical protein
MVPPFRAAGRQKDKEKQHAARQELPIVEHTWPVQKVRPHMPRGYHCRAIHGAAGAPGPRGGLKPRSA